MTRYSITCPDCGYTTTSKTENLARYGQSRHSCDRQRAKEAHALAAADKAAERERLIDRTPQPCHHRRANHQHGTYVTYTQDRCRCLPCTDAANTYNRSLARRNAYGRSNMVDAEPVRQHIRALMAAGVGLKQITRHTGINGGIMCKLLYGVHGRRPSRRVLKANAAKILALDPRDLRLVADGAIVPGIGTRRRLEALMTLGWSVPTMAARIGRERQSLDKILNRGLDTHAVTARAVAALYDELWDQPAPPGVGASRTILRAQRHRYAPPLAWDDDTIDNPAATPDVGEDKRPGGKQIHVDDIADLLTFDPTATTKQLAHRLHVTRDAIQQACRRAHRQDLLDQLNRNADLARPGQANKRGTKAA